MGGLKEGWEAIADSTRRLLDSLKFRTRRTEIHHLTRRGWVGFEGPPADRVETWEVEIYRPSRFYLVQSRTWTCIWAAPNVPRKERDELRAKHPIDDWCRYQLGFNIRVGDPL